LEVSALDANFFERIADGLDPQPDPWAADGPGWIRHRLGEHTWSKQDEILNSLRDNQKTAVRSAHSTGKSHIAARAMAWWMDTHPLDETFIISTAPSANQVTGILWRYLKMIHKRCGLPGYITESAVPEWKIDGGLRAWGRKPQDLTNPEEAATVFQGSHAKYLLIVIDEACGLPKWLWTAISTLATQPTNRILAIGNPDDPISEFAKKCMPGSRWHKIKISAHDTPAFTGEQVAQEIIDNLVTREWVQEAIEDNGEDSPYVTSKVFAEFPEVSEDSLIPLSWIQAAVDRDLSGPAIADLGKFSLDVGREGKDESVLAFWRAGMFRIVEARKGIGNTMRLVGWMSKHRKDHPASPFIVDADGIGGPVVDRARELEIPVTAFHAQRKAYNNKKFLNRRSEQWWQLRDLFEAGLIDLPSDQKLIAQLASIRKEEDSQGRIVVESKKDMKKRGVPSPDRADTLMMVTAPFEDWSEFDDDVMTGSAHDQGDFDSLTGDLMVREW
jgi:hypothetical protein